MNVCHSPSCERASDPCGADCDRGKATVTAKGKASPCRKSLRAKIGQKKATRNQLKFLEKFIKHGKVAFDESGIAERLYNELYPKTYNEWEDTEEFNEFIFKKFEQMLIFLWLSQICPKNRRFSPPKEIDLIWHTFMLFSIDYTKFCRRTVGHYIHHVPFTSRNRNKHKDKEQWLPGLNELSEFMGDNRVLLLIGMWEKPLPKKPAPRSASCDRNCDVGH